MSTKRAVLFVLYCVNLVVGTPADVEKIVMKSPREGFLGFLPRYLRLRVIHQPLIP